MSAQDSRHGESPMVPHEQDIAMEADQSNTIDSGVGQFMLPDSYIDQYAAQGQDIGNGNVVDPALTGTAALPQQASQPLNIEATSAAWREAVQRQASPSPSAGQTPAQSRRGASRQATSTRGGRRGRGRGRGRAGASASGSVEPHDSSPIGRYIPVDHNPPPENRAGRTRERSRNRREPPSYVPNDTTDEPGDQQVTSDANAGPRRPEMGDMRASDDDESRSIIWVDRARFDLLLQVAYERRHETMSEKAWRRIATGCHGGPFRYASWNAVRLEFSRLMRERFPGYGQDSPEAENRRREADQTARDQANGQPSTVTPADLDHNVTDASTECPMSRNASRGNNNNNNNNGETPTIASNGLPYTDEVLA